MAIDKSTKDRVKTASQIRAYINRQIPNEENLKRKLDNFMEALGPQLPTKANLDRKVDNFLKTVGAGKYSRASINKNVKSTAKDAATASAKRKVMDRVNTEQGKADRAKARTESAAKNQTQIKAKAKAETKSKELAKKRSGSPGQAVPMAKKKADSKEPRTIAEARRMGKSYFIGKDGKPKAAVTAEQLKKSGHKTLRAYLNAKGKPAKKGSK